MSTINSEGNEYYSAEKLIWEDVLKDDQQVNWIKDGWFKWVEKTGFGGHWKRNKKLTSNDEGPGEQDEEDDTAMGEILLPYDDDYDSGDMPALGENEDGNIPIDERNDSDHNRVGENDDSEMGIDDCERKQGKVNTAEENKQRLMRAKIIGMVKGNLSTRVVIMMITGENLRRMAKEILLLDPRRAKLV